MSGTECQCGVANYGFAARRTDALCVLERLGLCVRCVSLAFIVRREVPKRRTVCVIFSWLLLRMLERILWTDK